MPLSSRIYERLNEIREGAEWPYKELFLVKWKRGYEYVYSKFDKALIWLLLGRKGSGKSALLELIGCHYPRIIDLFGSRDNESLCWLKPESPIDDILLVIGDNTDLDCQFNTKRCSDLRFRDLMDYELITTCDAFYSSQEQKFLGVSKIIDQMWLRDGWNQPIFCGIREASSFLYSRIKLEGINMKSAKADFIYMQREMRHLGFTMGIDTIRWFSVDKEMRDLADYVILKKVGRSGLPSEISYFYNYIKPKQLATLSPDKFMIQGDYAIGIGKSLLPHFHKDEGESLVRELDLRPEYGEEAIESTAQQVGDKEHEQIIRFIHEGYIYDDISKQTHRSKSTISEHRQKHNQGIERLNYCEYCQRINSDLADVLI